MINRFYAYIIKDGYMQEPQDVLINLDDISEVCNKEFKDNYGNYRNGVLLIMKSGNRYYLNSETVQAIEAKINEQVLLG